MSVLSVKKSTIKNTAVRIPGSKSHTIRGLIIAALANGNSVLHNPLFSADTLSGAAVCRALGAGIELDPENRQIRVRGTGGKLSVPQNVVDVGNSGTTLYIALATSALVEGGSVVLTGDEQIVKRPALGLIKSLNDLGAEVFSTKNDGTAPIVVKGPLKGGKTSIECPTSQYLTSLLLNAPLACEKTHISVPLLNEAPYVEMTLRWLEKQQIRFDMAPDMSSFTVYPNQSYKPFEESIAADFSSGTFFAVLAAISGAKIMLEGLDMNDSQGDKEVFTILEKMGADITVKPEGIQVSGNKLTGMEIDMNNIPDALPAMAVAGCFASGTTRLVNVEHARLKETDRIKVMREELTKMGADITELPDGLEIKNSTLCAADLKGHGDHRIVMSLSLAGAMTPGTTTIDTAQAVAVTFPDFVQLMQKAGAETTIRES